MMNKVVVTLIGLMLPMCVIAQDNSSQVKLAIERIVRDYPQSTLQDIYKSFFQDKFGPEHIINDTVAAKRYLLSELSRTDIDTVIILEPTGANGNFVRVGLGAIKSGKVTERDFLNAFVRSAGISDRTSVAQWAEEWSEIVKVIDSMSLNFDNYKTDKEAINQVLEQGKYVMHHSQQYRDAYNPHYRIIAKEIFEQEILPLLK